MRIARMSAALGFIELFAIGAPEGYQPSTKYWRMMAAAAAAAGVRETLPAPCLLGTRGRVKRGPPPISGKPAEIFWVPRLIPAPPGGPPPPRRAQGVPALG